MYAGAPMTMTRPRPMSMRMSTVLRVLLLLLWLACAGVVRAAPSVVRELGEGPYAIGQTPGEGATQEQEQVVLGHGHGHGLGQPDSDSEGANKGWIDPRINGGRMLDFTTRHFGEPMNVIITALSDPYVLTEAGFHTYAKSIGFSEECMGLHYGNVHRADLGDGDGRKDEQFLARQYYFPVWGTCWESVAGGNHFRAWKQNGTLANSGAWFLGVSKEKDSSKNHKIVDNGYNLGRDWLVEKATAGSRWNGRWWRADVEWNEQDLLNEGSSGVNHGIEQDGRVAILTVRRI